MKSLNFEFLITHDPKLRQLAGIAEANFADDPNTTLIKMQQFGELLAGHVAAKAKMVSTVSPSGFSMVPNQGMFQAMEKYDHFTPEICNGVSNVAAD